MALTDLTGTKWYFNETIDLNNDFSYDINYTVNHSNLNWLRYGANPYRPLEKALFGVLDSFAYEIIFAGTWGGEQQNDEAYRTIEISGGTDATNATLIAWLQANATQILPPIIRKIKLPGSSTVYNIGTTWANVSNKPDLVTSDEATAYMQKGVDYVTAGKKSGTTLGDNATAEGLNTTASGPTSHTEGYMTTASGSMSHAEGISTTASGSYSHAEGNRTTASGQASHAEGVDAKASGSYSHAEGQNTTASGEKSHAEGNYTTASGYYSHAEGGNTTANHRSQHVFGEYNIADGSTNLTSNKGNYVEIVGNGTSDNARSNARTLDWDGNEILAGKLTVGAAPTGNMDVTTKQYVDNILATNDAMVFKGTIGAGGTITTLPATHEAGWTYKVITAGSLAGQTCEIGDMIVCIKDGTVATVDDWTVIQTNVDGAVVGPASSTAEHIATFTGTTGKVIKDSGFTIATSVPANAVFTDTKVEVIKLI